MSDKINGVKDQKDRVYMKYDPNFMHIGTHTRDCKEIYLNVDGGSVSACFSSLNFCLFL